MTTLDLTPGSPAATFPTMVLAHARMEARLLLRNGEQLVLALVIPVLVLVGGTFSGSVLDLGDGRRIDLVTPGVLSLAVLSTAFTSMAIATGFERRYGVLKRLGATPLPRSGLLLGKALSVLLIEAAQIVMLGLIALLLGWQPDPSPVGVVLALVLVLLATLAFASLALLMAGTLRAEATLAAANLVYVLLLVGGAVVLPVGDYPDSVQPVVLGLPTGALAEGLRRILDGSSPGIAPFIVLAVWSLIAGVLTSRSFTWD